MERAGRDRGTDDERRRRRRGEDAAREERRDEGAEQAKRPPAWARDRDVRRWVNAAVQDANFDDD